MARGLNKVMIIGNLGKDPEMKYNAEGKPITTFSVAVSRTWKSPDGQQSEETEWFRVVAWERLAETCNEYLRKGSKVYIEGRLKTRKWTTPEGQERQMVEVIASDMQMLDSRQQSGYGDEGGGGGGYRNERPAPQRQAGAASTAGASQSDDDTDMDVDDIPF
jgi:single-strand DNA-binding protein